ATISTPSNARASWTHSSRARHERSAAAAGKFSNRKDLRQGHLAGDSQRAAGVRAAGAAAGRSANQHRGVAVRRGLFRGDGVGDRDRARRGAHPVSRRGRAGGHFLGAQRAERRARPAARRGVPDDPVPVPARDHLGPDRARRLPAGAAQPDLVRGALRAAPTAATATAGRRGAAHRGRALMRLLLPPILLFVTFTATAGNFRAVEESGAVLYDAPSREATPVYVLSRDYPLEVLVELDAWAKVRDAAGAISWIEKRQLGERRTVVVTATSADAHLRPEDDAPVAFVASQNVWLVLAATPVAGLRELLEGLPAAQPFVWLCKGFEEGSGSLPHQIAEQTLGKSARCGALSGPSFAQEVARGLPCALTLASRDAGFARE